MAHTDSTAPRRLSERPWWGSYARKWASSGEIRDRAREYNRQDRHRARAELHRDGDAVPRQGRHRALWDAF